VAALGNSSTDLAADERCEVVPAETPGVIGITSVGPDAGLAYYSNWGDGEADVTAPGGSGNTGDPTTTILSTLPGNAWGSLQGTSMASPHAAGVAALIVSHYGKVRKSTGDVGLAPSVVEKILLQSATDVGASGYDEFFGHGRVDALGAVTWGD
jgi:subtilisin family serine protease